MKETAEYKSFQDILNFLSFDYKFGTKSYGYPFTQDPKNVIFSWGQILIPKFGIRETVQNKISDIQETPLDEITMMYQIPFVVVDNRNTKTLDRLHCGVINENISLGFRYDKQYKYGDITKSIYEVCYYITEHAEETNDFFIIPYDFVTDFFSYYIIPNQWGLGSTTCVAGCQARYCGEKINACDKYPTLQKCDCCGYVDNIDNDERCPECGNRFDYTSTSENAVPVNSDSEDERTVREEKKNE